MRLALTTSIALACAAQSASAQVALKATAEAHARPGGPLVATLSPGVRVTTGPVSGGSTQVTFDGWVDASRLGPKRDSFPAAVSGRLTLRLRATPSPSGNVVAVLQPGTGLHTVGRQGTWVRVRRAAWIATSSLRVPPVAPAPTLQGPAATATGAYIASTGARFRDLPVGRALGGLTAGSSVEIVARQSGWVRVRADGWVPEREIVGRDSVAVPDVTAADLRADPQGMRGRIVQWEVEIMSLQIADPLRTELARDEPYLLARGPGNENAMLYLAVPQSLLSDARGLAPLARVHITARVRSARSEPAGTPVLEILSLGKR